MKLFIIAPKKMIVSAKKLAANLGAKVIKPDSLTHIPRRDYYYLNWGNSKQYTFIPPHTLLNDYGEVQRAINKLKTFELLKDKVNVPDYTTKKDVATTWNCDVVCRSILTGFGGDGITIAHSSSLPEDSLLYVKYIKKKHEYRVHVFADEVIDVTQKKKKIGFEGRNNQVRNYHNGWIYARDGIIEPANLRQLALDTIRTLELDFGAVDIIWNEHQNKCYVLEVNTAPGLTGTTLEAYTKAIKQWMNPYA